MKKRIVSLLLSLITVLTLMPLGAMATQSRKENFNKDYTLTGDMAMDICIVANAQAGLTQEELGYTEKWCADFVCDCARLAHVPTKVIGNHGLASRLCETVLEAGGLVVTEPRAGDLVVYQGTSKGTGEFRIFHVGIMTGENSVAQGNISGGKVRTDKTPGNYVNNLYDWTYFFVRPNYPPAEKSFFGGLFENLSDMFKDFFAKLFSWLPFC